MKYTSINIQGNILTSEILEKIRTESIGYQKSSDFNLEKNATIRDEINLAWTTCRAHWQAFQVRRERLTENDTGTTLTRERWIKPFLMEFGYELEKSETEFINNKSYAISYRVQNRDSFPVHAVGINQSMDKRAEIGGTRLSPHALVQEYLNNHDHLYALVTNGKYLRLLRDATRLSRLSYLEFDLERMMEDNLFNEFALLFRLLHVTRMPEQKDAGEDSIIEFYHQESLASGSRIRDKLSIAVEDAIRDLANGFLSNPSNEKLKEKLLNNQLKADGIYLFLLRLVYRMLFIMVIEERNLIYPENRDKLLHRLQDIYFRHYSMKRLRELALRSLYVDKSCIDLWEGFKLTMQLFESEKHGSKLGIESMGSGLFEPGAIGDLDGLKLSNRSFIKVLKALSSFENEHRQLVIINYADLDVEEFGSVYEGLLEYDPVIEPIGDTLAFSFKKGSGRSSSGSHYTPEELVKPLIKHSLDYIIEDRLKVPPTVIASAAKQSVQEKQLLSITVCDVACGSGHILLNAARRIGFELAKVRTGEDQPSPAPFRLAVRDVIQHCIYGVDKNPLAVELCKVALWLEAHNPGKPLNFLDHRIKCGDSIVGLAHREELENGIPDEAFKTLAEDDKTIAAAFRNRNKEERKDRSQLGLYDETIHQEVDRVIEKFQLFKDLPEKTPEEIAAKAKAHSKYNQTVERIRLKQLADAQVAQFFIPKTALNKEYLLTDSEYRSYLRLLSKGMGAIQSRKLAYASDIVANSNNFFHWFLEFPEVFNLGGFDCILGNPPFLKGAGISGNFGYFFLNFIYTTYFPLGGQADLVSYFFRRNYGIIKRNGFISLISTNTISQGDSRKGSLDYILLEGGNVVFGIKSMKWPGKAAVEVALLSLYKGKWQNLCTLGLKKVNYISSYIDDSETSLEAVKLIRNSNISYRGVMIAGMGFLLDNFKDFKIIQNKDFNEVIKPYLNGDDVNNIPEQKSERHIIHFYDWPLKRLDILEWNNLLPEQKNEITKDGIFASPYYKFPVANDYPLLLEIVEEKVKPERDNAKEARTQERWWLLGRTGSGLRESVKEINYVFVSTRITKHLAFSRFSKNNVFADLCVVVARESYSFFTQIQSSLHEAWAWKYSSTLGSGTLNYSNANCFETFPFILHPSITFEENLKKIGEQYHDTRQQIMLKLLLGLTKTYNLLHCCGIRAHNIDDKDKQVLALQKNLNINPNVISFNFAVQGILKLRELHVQMDNAVLEAYGWHENSDKWGPAIQLRHDFYEVDYLPENDRIRYTIHPEARKEVLKRLLKLNHEMHEEEVKQGLWEKDKKKDKSKKPQVKRKKSGSNKVEEPESPNVQTRLFEDPNLFNQGY